jgi:hypothetical protein
VISKKEDKLDKPELTKEEQPQPRGSAVIAAEPAQKIYAKGSMEWAAQEEARKRRETAAERETQDALDLEKAGDTWLLPNGGEDAAIVQTKRTRPTATAPPADSGGPSLADDLLRGIKAISEFIGEDERRVYYLAEKNIIPVGKEGDGRWIASKRALRTHYARLTGGTAV